MLNAEKSLLAQQGRSTAALNVEFTPVEGKACKKCGKIYPNSNDYFRIYNGGLYHTCKKCLATNKESFTLKITGMVYCTSCLRYLPKSVEFFYKKELQDGYFKGTCINCRKERGSEAVLSSEEKRNKRKERAKKWVDENKDRHIENGRRWKNKNKHLVKLMAIEYDKKPETKQARKAAAKRRYMLNPEKYRSKASESHRRIRKARPLWYDRERIEIRKLYLEASKLGLQVDHIVPINSSLVCGLHCLANLRLLSATENQSKSNRWWPDMPQEIK